MQSNIKRIVSVQLTDPDNDDQTYDQITKIGLLLPLSGWEVDCLVDTCRIKSCSSKGLAVVNDYFDYTRLIKSSWSIRSDSVHQLSKIIDESVKKDSSHRISRELEGRSSHDRHLGTSSSSVNACVSQLLRSTIDFCSNVCNLRRLQANPCPFFYAGSSSISTPPNKFMSSLTTSEMIQNNARMLKTLLDMADGSIFEDTTIKRLYIALAPIIEPSLFLRTLSYQKLYERLSPPDIEDYNLIHATMKEFLALEDRIKKSYHDIFGDDFEDADRILSNFPTLRLPYRGVKQSISQLDWVSKCLNDYKKLSTNFKLIIKLLENHALNKPKEPTAPNPYVQITPKDVLLSPSLSKLQGAKIAEVEDVSDITRNSTPRTATLSSSLYVTPNTDAIPSIGDKMSTIESIAVVDEPVVVDVKPVYVDQATNVVPDDICYDNEKFDISHQTDNSSVDELAITIPALMNGVTCINEEEEDTIICIDDTITNNKDTSIYNDSASTLLVENLDHTVVYDTTNIMHTPSLSMQSPISPISMNKSFYINAESIHYAIQSVSYNHTASIEDYAQMKIAIWWSLLWPTYRLRKHRANKQLVEGVISGILENVNAIAVRNMRKKLKLIRDGAAIRIQRQYRQYRRHRKDIQVMQLYPEIEVHVILEEVAVVEKVVHEVVVHEEVISEEIIHEEVMTDDVVDIEGKDEIVSTIQFSIIKDVIHEEVITKDVVDLTSVEEVMENQPIQEDDISIISHHTRVSIDRISSISSVPVEMVILKPKSSHRELLSTIRRGMLARRIQRWFRSWHVNKIRKYKKLRLAVRKANAWRSIERLVNRVAVSIRIFRYITYWRMKRKGRSSMMSTSSLRLARIIEAYFMLILCLSESPSVKQRHIPPSTPTSKQIPSIKQTSFTIKPHPAIETQQLVSLSTPSISNNTYPMPIYSEKAVVIQKYTRRMLVLKHNVIRRMKAMWFLHGKLIMFVAKLKLRNKKTRVFRAATRIQKSYRGYVARLLLFLQVEASMKISKAWKNYLELRHLKQTLRRVERPYSIRLRRLRCIPAHMAQANIKVRVSVWWNPLLHIISPSEYEGFMKTKKPQYVYYSNCKTVKESTRKTRGTNMSKLRTSMFGRNGQASDVLIPLSTTSQKVSSPVNITPQTPPLLNVSPPRMKPSNRYSINTSRLLPTNIDDDDKLLSSPVSSPISIKDKSVSPINNYNTNPMTISSPTSINNNNPSVINNSTASKNTTAINSSTTPTPSMNGAPKRLTITNVNSNVPHKALPLDAFSRPSGNAARRLTSRQSPSSNRSITDTNPNRQSPPPQQATFTPPPQPRQPRQSILASPQQQPQPLQHRQLNQRQSQLQRQPRGSMNAASSRSLPRFSSNRISIRNPNILNQRAINDSDRNLEPTDMRRRVARNSQMNIESLPPSQDQRVPKHRNSTRKSARFHQDTMPSFRGNNDNNTPPQLQNRLISSRRQISRISEGSELYDRQPVNRYQDNEENEATDDNKSLSPFKSFIGSFDRSQLLHNIYHSFSRQPPPQVSSKNNDNRPGNRASKVRPLFVCEFEDEVVRIPACHGNSVIRFDFMMGDKKIGSCSFHMSSEGRLLYWGGQYSKEVSLRDFRRGAQLNPTGQSALAVNERNRSSLRDLIPFFEFSIIPGAALRSKAQWGYLRSIGNGLIRRAFTSRHFFMSLFFNPWEKVFVSLDKDGIYLFEERHSTVCIASFPVDQILGIRIEAGESLSNRMQLGEKNALEHLYDIIIHTSKEELFLRFPDPASRVTWYEALNVACGMCELERSEKVNDAGMKVDHGRLSSPFINIRKTQEHILASAHSAARLKALVSSRGSVLAPKR